MQHNNLHLISQYVHKVHDHITPGSFKNRGHEFMLECFVHDNKITRSRMLSIRDLDTSLQTIPHSEQTIVVFHRDTTAHFATSTALKYTYKTSFSEHKGILNELG
jgi:hypothetical protein